MKNKFLELIIHAFDKTCPCVILSVSLPYLLFLGLLKDCFVDDKLISIEYHDIIEQTDIGL